jgi:hypothetical protein
MLAALRGVGGKDHLEWLLATQVVTAHAAAMRAARRLSLSQTLMETEYTEKVYSKTARTFAMLLETLQRYRARSRQGKIVVKSESAKESKKAQVDQKPR